MDFSCNFEFKSGNGQFSLLLLLRHVVAYPATRGSRLVGWLIGIITTVNQLKDIYCCLTLCHGRRNHGELELPGFRAEG